MTLVRMPAEVERHEPQARAWIDVMLPAIELAKSIAATDFVPSRFRNNAAQISAAILYGDEIGLGPMQSLAHIAVIEGTPSLAAETQRALVLAAGHEIWPEEMSIERVTWCGRRAGSDAITRITWTMDDARKANLAGRQNYRTYPRQMLSARASAELVRAIFADVVGGLIAREELDEGAQQSAAAAADRPASSRPKRQRSAPAVAVAVPSPVLHQEDASPSALPPLPGDETYPLQDRAAQQAELSAEIADANARLQNAPSSETQRRRIHAQFRAVGISDRDARLAHASQVIGRTVDTSKDLTAREADQLSADLERLKGERSIEGAPENTPAEDQPELDV